MSSSPRVLVLGSANLDLVVRAARLPAPGETLVADDFRQISGGKGANQAIAAARLGARVDFVARVGRDPAADTLEASLRAAGLTPHLRRDALPTGKALILVEASGENRILIAPGANAAFDADDVVEAFDRLPRPDIVLLQLEIPFLAVRRAIELGAKRGIPVVLDAGPATAVPLDRLRGLHVLSPNETETEALTGIAPVDLESARRAADRLETETGAKHVVLKLGSRGALFRLKGRWALAPAHRVDAVDTTAAGDAFTAALAVDLARGLDLTLAVASANAAGALASTRVGAEPSLPTREEIDELLSSDETWH